MTHNLFDIASMNLIDWFDSLDEALAAVRAIMRAHGVEAGVTRGCFPTKQTIRNEWGAASRAAVRPTPVLSAVIAAHSSRYRPVAAGTVSASWW